MIKQNNNALLGTGILAAVASSLCCIVPLIAAIASISGVASSFSWIEPARPYLMGFTALALGGAWYLKIRPVKSEGDDCGCEVKAKKSYFQSTNFLAMVTVFGVLMMAFPLYAHVFYADGNEQETLIQETNLTEGQFTIKGMTCSGCEHHVKKALTDEEGVSDAEASYKKGTANVKFDKTKTSLEHLAAAIEKETGYKVTIHK